MILTVTLNAALDATYGVDRIRPHTSHRILSTHERAGGKGINVARVLASLGQRTMITGLVGGPTGIRLRADLRAAGLCDELVGIEEDSRRTVTIVSRDDGDATVFNQNGPHVNPGEWSAFCDRFAQLVRDARVVTLCGSLPAGLPSDAYARLIRTAAEAGAVTIVDTSGPPLLDSLGAGPDVVKPNATELAAVAGHDDVLKACTQLRALGARAVVASSGADGLLAVTGTGSWYAAPPERLAGNPTGAGDACVAALAAGLASGAPWPALLREAVALSAAAVPCPVAGDFDAHTRRRLLEAVEVGEVLGDRAN